MLKVSFVYLFLFTIQFEYWKADNITEFPVTDIELDDFSNKSESQGNVTARKMDTFVEEEDVYDDYIKIRIFQGAELRTALKRTDALWENGVVPYEISNDYKQEDRDSISNAFEEFHNKTCVKFQRRTNEISYISIIPGSKCSAVVGNSDRRNNVVLGENCLVLGIIIHELMHSLGFLHEHTRPDRDNFVRIVYDNIRKGAEGNFKKFSAGEVEIFNQTYDYGSVMHYGPHDFAKNRSKPTIIAHRSGVEIGQRDGFSLMDLIKINLMYNCNVTQNSHNATDATKRSAEKSQNVPIETDGTTTTRNTDEKTTEAVEEEDQYRYYERVPKIRRYPWRSYFAWRYYLSRY